MKLAIVVAVSKYAGSGLSDLPGCTQDGNLIHTILTAQNIYQEILLMTAKTNSTDIKQNLIEFVSKYKGKSVSEFLFYYTGHGIFLNNEYYYLLSDYQQAKLRQTALENTELDNLVRSLNPVLTTKIVDSCQSGLPYIKDSGEISTYLKGTQSGFQNCYFLFSSHTGESSYQDNILSAFTRSIGELVASRVGIIRHKDIIDYVSDSFTLNTLQTPFFVVQADFTDQFCKVDSTLQKKVADLLALAAHSPITAGASPAGGTTLKALVEEDAKFYCTKDEAFNTVTQLKNHLDKYKHPTEVEELFKIEVSQLADYSSIPNIIAIGKWLKETKHNFFAEPIWETVRVKKPTLRGIMKAIPGGSFSGLGDHDFELIMEQRISGVKSTTEMPYSGLMIQAKAIYPNLNSTACFLVPFVSRTHMMLFASTVFYSIRGWEDDVITGEVKWRTYEERIKDDELILKTISTMINDFWDFTMTAVKMKFGQLKEESESDSSKKPGEAS